MQEPVRILPRYLPLTDDSFLLKNNIFFLLVLIFVFSLWLSFAIYVR